MLHFVTEYEIVYIFGPHLIVIKLPNITHRTEDRFHGTFFSSPNPSYCVTSPASNMTYLRFEIKTAVQGCIRVYKSAKKYDVKR